MGKHRNTRNTGVLVSNKEVVLLLEKVLGNSLWIGCYYSNKLVSIGKVNNSNNSNRFTLFIFPPKK